MLDKNCSECKGKLTYKKRYVLGEGQPSISQQYPTQISLTSMSSPHGPYLKLTVTPEMAFVMPKYRLILERID